MRFRSSAEPVCHTQELLHASSSVGAVLMTGDKSFDHGLRVKWLEEFGLKSVVADFQAAFIQYILPLPRADNSFSADVNSLFSS